MKENDRVRTQFNDHTMRLENVSFAYRPWSRPIFQDLCADVEIGRTVLLGPNAAGKSTLVKLICGLLRPRSGRILLQGQPLSRGGPRVGYLPQAPRALAGLTTLEQVSYAAWLAGHSHRTSAALAADLLDQVGLAEVATRPSINLSGGQGRRLGLAEALAGAGDLLILDEPTAGLDPGQRRAFRALMQNLTVPYLVTTHLISDVADVFDDVLVMSEGTVAFNGRVEDFLACDTSGEANPEAAYDAVTGGEQ